jgi:hypothetical protein
MTRWELVGGATSEGAERVPCPAADGEAINDIGECSVQERKTASLPIAEQPGSQHGESVRRFHFNV